MELHLQPPSTSCHLTGQPFVGGQRVASYLVRGTGEEVQRYDLDARVADEFKPEGEVACYWVHAFKPRAVHDNPQREMKLTAETLFLTLADPDIELSEENGRMVQFLALMLERKRVLRPKGRTTDGERLVYEHRGTKTLYEVPAAPMDPAFFIAVQEQLSVLMGEAAG